MNPEQRNNSVKIVAEAEINHNGSRDLALKLVDAAKACGADAVKFQCFVADSFIAPGSTFLQIFKDNELGLDDFRAIRDRAKEAGIEVFATAGDTDGLAMIVDLGLPIVKIGSTNITNHPLLRAVAETGKEVYLSTGAATLGEIEAALDALAAGGGKVTLFHCTVQYPAPADLLNLRAIPTMAAAFRSMAIGYSDHSRGVSAGVIATALGATVLEKHFTLDNELPGPDHSFSADPEAMTAYINAVREAERMLGSPIKAPVAEEQAIRVAGRRYITAMTDIAAGATIGPDMVRPRRINVPAVEPASLIGPEDQPAVIGRRARRDIASGGTLSWADLEAND